MANQWSAVRAHQQGLTNLSPAPDPQPAPSPRPAAPARVVGSGQPTVLPLPPPVPYPSSSNLLATETKGAWGNVVPLPKDDFFPAAAEPTPEYELLRWGLDFGEGWSLRWRRYTLGEGNVISSGLDAKDIAGKGDQRLLRVPKALEQASDGGKWIWTLRREVLWVFAMGGSDEEEPFPDLGALGMPFFAGASPPA